MKKFERIVLTNLNLESGEIVSFLDCGHFVKCEITSGGDNAVHVSCSSCAVNVLMIAKRMEGEIR